MATEDPVVEIELHRGNLGLGFNIRGGKDNPHIQGDTGIFVAKLTETGAAAKDGRLKKGDKILEINGTTVEAANHNDAVALFHTAGETIKLKVFPGAETIIQERIAASGGTNQASGVMRPLVIVLGLAAVGTVAYFGYRRFKQTS